MHDELTTWVPLNTEKDAPWLGLHFETINGRIECVALELRTARPGERPTRGLRTRDDVRAIKLETHIHAAAERNPKLKAAIDEATGGPLGARGKYDRAHYERVTSIYATAVLQHVGSPAQTVQTVLGISYPAAMSQIARARELGLLPAHRSWKERTELEEGAEELEYLSAVMQIDLALAGELLRTEADSIRRRNREDQATLRRYEARSGPRDHADESGRTLQDVIDDLTGATGHYAELEAELRAWANEIAPKPKKQPRKGKQ